jgi:DNA-binding GntR family transcriptional regulator
MRLQAISNTSGTLNDQVYRKIREMILKGKLVPGIQLVQRRLAATLGTSTMPVVEALRRLERDGFVIAIPKSGVYVKEWTDEEIREAAYIRRALEGEAGRLFIERASREDRAKLVQLSEEFDHWATIDPIRADEADLEFHLHLVRATRFPHLYQLVESSKIQQMTIWRRSYQGVDFRKLVGCHRPIVEAILANDEERTLRAIWNHGPAAVSAVVPQRAGRRGRQ